jgi:chemosensory pili system protein ChpA (sensor histidine kinase/response regulator)
MQQNDATDIDLAVNDLGPLAWVLEELRKSLDGATKALRRFVRDADLARGSDLAAIDGSQLRIARQQLHQAVGALEMVGLGAPASVLKAMEAVVQKFVLRPELCNEDAAAKVERASFALTEYLESVLVGKSVSPIALFPQYREVQELAGTDRIHPADLWPMEWRWIDPQMPASAAAMTYEPAVRSRLDQTVLKIVKGADVTSAREMRDISLSLSSSQTAMQPRIFWKICSAFFEAIGLGLLPGDVYVKRAASRILMQYTTLAKGDLGVSDRLALDLLFFCMQAVPANVADAPALCAVREAYGLARFKPVDYRTSLFGRFDPTLLAQARKRIAAAKDTWSALSGGDVNKLKSVVDQFSLVTDSLVKLHPASAPLAQALIRSVESTTRTGQSPSTELAMEVATSILYLEAAFEDLDPADETLAVRTTHLAERLENVRNGGQPQPLESWMEELYRRVSDRQNMGSVVGELRTNLGELEKSLDQFFRNPQDKVALRDVPTQLSQMRGVLSVLGLDQASLAVMRMRDAVEGIMTTEIDEEKARAAGTFDKLGNNLGALGFLIDMLNYQPALAKKLFVYDDERGELKPLMGRAHQAIPESEAPLPQGMETTQVLNMPAGVDMQQTMALKLPASAPAEQVPHMATLSLNEPALDFSAPTAAPASASAADIDEDDGEAELRDIFLEEAREVVQTGLAAIATLKENPADMSEQTTLRRAFHTLKGSSRMVGLNEFGEAAWSMEQVLNAWLAEQKPVNPDLLSLSHDAMQGFGRWSDDIAAGTDSAWKSGMFRSSAEALRNEARLLPLQLPAQSLAVPVAVPVAVAVTEPVQAVPDQVADLPDFDVPTAEAPASEAPVAEAPVVQTPVADEPLKDFGDFDDFFNADSQTAPVASSSSTELAEALSEPAPEPAVVAGPAPDFDFALDLSDVADVADVPDVAAITDVSDVSEEPDWLAAVAREQAPAELEAPGEIEGIDFGSLSAVSGLAPDALPASAVPVAAMDLPDFDVPLEASSPVSSQLAQTSADLDLDDFDMVEPVAAAPVAEPESQPEPVSAVEPDTDMDFSDDLVAAADEQVKVIGPLRIGIPLYNVYLNEADEWSRRLVTEVAEWALELNTPIADSTVGLAHSLAGSSATVGFAALSEMARALEHSLQHAQLRSTGTDEQARAFTGAAEDIRRLLHQFAAGFLKEPDADVLQALKDLEIREAAAQEHSYDLEDQEDPAADRVMSLSGFGDLDFASSLASVTIINTPPPQAEPPQAEPPPAEPQRPFAQELAAPVVRPFVAPAQTTVAAPQPPREATHDEDDEIDAVDAIDPDLFPIFEEEALELMPQLGGALRQWSARPDNRGARDEVLRALHTLKGSARLSGALRLGEMAHRLESEIEYFGSESLESSQFEPLVTRFDAMQGTFDALRLIDLQAAVPEPELQEDVAETTDVAPAISQPIVKPVEGQPSTADVAARRALIALPATNVLAPVRQAANQAVRVRSQLLDRLVNQAGEVMITRSRLEAELGNLRGSLNDLTGNLDRLRSQLRDIELQAESQMQTRLAQAKDTAQGFDPLEFDRFTRVQELTRMMAESVNDVATVQRNLQRTVESTEDDLIAQARQTRELQRDLLRTRMVEFEGISERLYRVVRQASKDTGKQVKLDITGGSIEMDRGVLDRMTPAFEHLLRNCVAHGIEDPEVRSSAGKDASGTIVIDLKQEGNDVSVEFRDDGAGLDLPRIREKAIAQGLLAPEQDMTDADAANMIFMAGFSTAANVTELSGRGIGMDVVRSEVNALGGRIETSTQAGKGTNFKLVLPLTTAVTQVVMMRTAKLSFGAPANLVELVRRASHKEVELAYNSGMYEFAGEQVPFFWSGALLQVSQRSADVQTRTIPVVIFRSAAQRVAMHIDEVLGNQEVVVKNLGPQLSRLPGLAGMTVLASGAVALIYNPVALAAVYGEQARALSADHAQPDVLGQSGTGKAVIAAAAAAPQIPLVLVVDDSITVRRVTQRLLVREGYRVALAADGLQALERLQQERPTVVLSDIEMPRMDGFDLARNIRGDARLADLPIIMITSRIAGKHREHAMELGVNNYLGKPYSEEELLSLVRHYCSVETA